jgi:hypothetical protein
MGWEITACVGALIGLGFLAGPADRILALFPESPSGQLACKGLTEAEAQTIERELGVRVRPSYREDRPNWYEDRNYIMSGIMKLSALSEFQGSLDLLCRLIEASPSLAIDPATLSYYLSESEKPLSRTEGLLPAADKNGELTGAGQSKRGLGIRPTWNPKSLTLSVGNVVCHKFTRRLGNQIEVLKSLEAAGWPEKTIPNPLRDESQLRQTIKDFNKASVDGSTFRLIQDHNQVGWTIG